LSAKEQLGIHLHSGPLNPGGKYRFKFAGDSPAPVVLKKVFSNPPAAFTNIGVLDKVKLTLGPDGMAAGFMTGSIKYRDYFQVSLSTFDGEAVFCINLYGTKNDRNNIATFLDTFISELTAGSCPA
jgi:NRPS condensation-like uncharacterized protein